MTTPIKSKPDIVMPSKAGIEAQIKELQDQYDSANEEHEASGERLLRLHGTLEAWHRLRLAVIDTTDAPAAEADVVSTT